MADVSRLEAVIGIEQMAQGTRFDNESICARLNARIRPDGHSVSLLLARGRIGETPRHSIAVPGREGGGWRITRKATPDGATVRTR